MKIPEVAYNTFQELKGNTFFKRITDEIVQKLTKLTDPIKRAKLFHTFVNQQLESDLAEIKNTDLISCRKGCAACCYSNVAVTMDEVKLLATHVVQGMDIDFNRLEKQVSAQTEQFKWSDLDYESRRCVFLNEMNECRVYEDRPSVCRSNMVVSHPLLCDTKNGGEKPIRLVNTPKTNMAIAGAFLNTDQAGVLPQLLWGQITQNSLQLQNESKMHSVSKSK